MTNIRKAILSGASVAAIAVAAVITFNISADAKPATCSARHTGCTEHCIMGAGNFDAGQACIRRTCDHQFNSCMSDSSGGGERGGSGGRTGGTGGVGGPGKSTGKPVVRDHRK